MRYLSNLACLLIGSVLHGQISYPAYDYNVTENFQSSSSATFSISLPTDYNGNSLIAHKVVVTPTKGVFQSTTGTTLTYTPTTFQSGADTFDWNATDMVTGEQIAFRATIQIEELNSPPVIESISGESGGSLSFSENQNLVTTVRISDPDSNGLSVPPTLELNVTGTHSQYFEVGSPSSSISSKYDYPINFKPTPDFETWEAANLISFSIDFNASDFNSSSDYQSSHLVSVTLSISDQNEAPVIQEGIGGSSPHTSISISEDNIPDSWPDEGVSLTAIDEDGDQVYWKFDTNRTNGTIGTITLKDSANSTVLATLSEGVYTAADFNTGTTLKAHYSATSNLFGSETLTFTVKDGSGLTDTFGIAVTVTQDSSDDSPSLNESSTIAVSFAENGTGQIHDFNPTDPDYPDVADEATLTYSLSGEDSSLFAISTGGVLTFNDAPDYDASTSADGDQTYELSVILSDGTGTADDSQDLEVTITNVDEAPDFSLSSPITFNLEEDTTWNWTDLASPLTASDPDSGDEATLSWQVQTAPMFGATIDLNGTGSAPTTFNYQPKTDYSGSDTFVIKVADADGLSASLTFNVTISEVEEAPVITSFDGNATVSLQREENSPSTIQVSASDPDTGDTISYSIVGGADQAKFTIDSSSGDLTFSDTQPDYESPSDSGNNNVYEVQVRAQDASGNSDEQVFNVQITDVDESPYFTTNGSLSLVENSQYVTDVNASATDATDSGTIDFSLPAVSNSLDRVKFDVNASSGVLTFVSAPNFESPTDSNADNSYIVIVRATDSGGSAFLDLEHNITIVDANDAPVITSTDTFPITEGLTLVANLTASDQDSGEVLSWSIIDGNDTFFNLESNGTLSFKNASDNDFESGVGYTLTVQVTDTGGASDSQVISIQPLNTNESPSFRSEVVTESSDEDIDFRGHDLNQYVSDPEGDTLTFTLLTSNDNAFVTADGNFSLIAQANDSGTVDLNVSVSDGLLTDIMLIRVSFLPVNDDPVISDETMWSGLIYVDENTDANTDVIDLNLTDVDDSELNGIYEWEILPKDGNASHNDYKLFTILSTGGVRFIESPDFEDDLSVSGENKYEFDVNASDSSGGSHLITLRIKVQDLDEQLKQNLTLIPTINTSEETEVNGSLIGTVTDPEGQPLSYSLEVNASKGTINLNSDGTFVYIPNKNETGSDSAEFRIADTSGQSVNVASSFIINGVNDPPAIDAVAGGLVEIAENTPRDTVIYDLNLTDPDDTDANVSNSYLWSLYPKADDFNHTDYLKFQLDPTTGQLRFLSSPDRESDLSAGQINRYEMKIYATDPTDLNSSVDLTILVTNVEEPPLASKPSIFATNEEVEIKDNLLNYVTDPEGSQLTFTLLREPSNGLITYFDPTEGNFTYIPNTDFFGNDFFEFNASDNTNQFLEINCSVTVNNVEDAPVVTIIENDRILIPENFSATSVLYDFNHTDADEANASNPLGLYEWEIGPPSTDLNSMDYQFLYLSKYEGELKFQESPDYENNRTTDNVFQISVKVTDSQGLHGSYDLRVQVQDVDEPPVLSESYTGSFDTMEDTDLSINLSEFITDPEGLSMTFSQTTPDSNITGTIRDLVTSSGSFIYSPKPQESGMDDFNFTVTDINSNTIPVSIFVNVIDQNDAPVIDEVPANLITVLENTSASVTIYDFNATDEDDTDGNASNDLVFWSLRQISGEIDPFDYFYVNSGNGKLRFINPPDYEDGKSIGSTIQQMNDYKLTVRVADADSAFSDLNITVRVTNEEEQPVTTSTILPPILTQQNVPIDGSFSDFVYDPEGMTVVYDVVSQPSKGVLTIDAQGTYSFIPNPDAFTDAFDDNYTISFWDSDTDPVEVNGTIRITNTSDSPVISPPGGVTIVTVTENLPTTSMVSDLNFTDPDDASPTIGDYRWSISAFEDQPNHDDFSKFRIDDLNGSLYFYSIPDYDDDQSESQDNQYKLRVKVTDPDNNVGHLDLTVKVTDENEKPVFTDGFLTDANDTYGVLTLSTMEDQSLPIDLSTYVSDPEQGTLLYSIKEGARPTQGNAVSLDGTAGTFTYEPDDDYFGEDNMTWVIRDSLPGNDVEILLKILIQSVNDPPVLTSSSSIFKVYENNRTVHPTSDNLISLTDVDDNDLSDTYLWKFKEDSGIADYELFDLDQDDGSIFFKNAPDYENPEDADFDNRYEIVVQVQDEEGGVAELSLTVKVLPVDEPIYLSDVEKLVINTNEEVPAAGDLRSLVVDPENGLINYSEATTELGEITVSESTGELLFVPGEDKFGKETIEFVLNDSEDENRSLSVQVELVVNSLNDTPIISTVPTGNVIDFNETTSSVFPVYDFNFTDADEINQSEPAGIYYWSIGPKNGDSTHMDHQLFYIDEEGLLKFREDPDYEKDQSSGGINRYEMVVSVTDFYDANGSIPISVRVLDFDENPVLSEPALSLTTNEDESILLDLASVVTDPEGKTLTYDLVAGKEPSEGNVTSLLPSYNGQITYLPGSNISGRDAMTFKITDLANNFVEIDVNLLIVSVNDLPSISDFEETLTYVENEDSTIFDFNVTDVETTSGFEWEVVGSDATMFQISQEGLLNFKTPPDRENPMDSDADNIYEFTVRVFDNLGAEDNGSVRIRVLNAMEDPNLLHSNPLILNIDEDNQITFDVNATDQEDPNDLVFQSSQPDSGEVFIHPQTGVLTYTPLPNTNGFDEFEVTVTDSDQGTDSVKVIVNVFPQNDLPKIENLPLEGSIKVDENVILVYDFDTNDSDDLSNAASTFYWKITGGDDEMVFTIGALDGVLRFKEAPNYENPMDADLQNTYDLEIGVSDDGFEYRKYLISVMVTPVNDPPVFTDLDGNLTISLAVRENVSVLYQPSVEDPERDQVRFSLNNDAANRFKVDELSGMVTIANPEDMDYEGNLGNSSLFFELNASDDGQPSASSIRTVILEILDVDEPPVLGDLLKDANVSENSGMTWQVGVDHDDLGQSLTYEIVEVGDYRHFEINSVTGEFIFALEHDALDYLNQAKPYSYEADYERPKDANGDNLYELTLRVGDDQGNTSSKAFEIEVTDVNEEPIFSDPVGQRWNNMSIYENETKVVRLEESIVDLDGGFRTLDVLASGGRDPAIFPSFGTPDSPMVFSLEDNSSVLIAHAADLDRDGRMDVVNLKEDGVSWFRNIYEGNGFAFESAKPIYLVADNQEMLDYMVVGDLNEDGFEDLVVVFAQPSRSLSWFRNEGDGSFREFKLSLDDSHASALRFVALEDLNGDHRLDLVLVSTVRNYVSWLANTGKVGSNRFKVESNSLISSSETVGHPVKPMHPVLADVDADGDHDLLIAASGGPTVTLFSNLDGLGTFDSGKILLDKSHDLEGVVQTVESYGALAVADLNDDQVPEILYGARYSADRSTLVGSLYADVNQTYLKKPIFSSSAPSVDHIVVGDLNGDGLVDLVSSHSSEGTIRRHIQYEGNFSNAPDGIELVFPSNSPNRLQLVDLSIKKDPLTFSIQSGYDSDFFEMFNPKTGDLRFLEPPNYENPLDRDINGEYKVVVMASDGFLDSTQEIYVNVLDRNEIPLFLSSPSLLKAPENQRFVSDFFFSDNNESQEYTLSLHGPDSHLFALPEMDLSFASSSIMKFSLLFDQEPDFETPLDADKNGVYELELRATDDGNLSGSKNLSVEVTNENDSPLLENPPLEPILMSEDSDPIGWQSPDLNGFDYDSGESVSWSISRQAVHGFAEFRDESNSSTLVYQPNLDYFGDDNFTIRLTDDSGLDHFTDYLIRVSIEDVNDLPVLVLQQSYEVRENESLVVRLDSKSSFGDEVDELTYSFTGSANDNELFFLDANNSLLFSSPPNFEIPIDEYKPKKDNQYRAVLEVFEAGIAIDQFLEITINVMDVNDPPELLDFQSLEENETLTLEIQENEDSVFVFSARDDDFVDELSYSISGPDSKLFLINSENGVLEFKDPPDYEFPLDEIPSDNLYQLTVSVGDSRPQPLFDSLSLTVKVTDQNEPPYLLPSPNGEYVFVVSENETFVGLVSADEDDEDGNFTYAILPGKDADLFTVDPFTGELSLIQPLDYEQDPTNYQILLQVTDDANFTDQREYDVILENLNDIRPVLNKMTYVLPPAISGTGNTGPFSYELNRTGVTEFTFYENSDASILTLEAVDGDGDPLIYQIVGGNDESRFQLDPDRGVLTLTKPLNPSVLPEDRSAKFDSFYELSVRASDGLNKSSVRNLILEALPTDVTAPSISSANRAFIDDEVYDVDVLENQTFVLDFDWVDDNPVYSILSGPDADKFMGPDEQGVLRFKDLNSSWYDYENFQLTRGNNKPYEIHLEFTDVFNSVKFTLNVYLENDDEFPVITGISSPYTLNEDSELSIEVLAFDPDYPDSEISPEFSDPPYGTAYWNSSSKILTYSPDADFNGDDNFTIAAIDQNESATFYVIDLEVLPVNDPPIAFPDLFIVDGDGIQLDVLVNDSPGAPDEDSNFSLSLPTGITDLGGEVTISGNLLNYTPPVGYVGIDTFEYMVVDHQYGDVQSDQASVQVVVHKATTGLPNWRFLKNFGYYSMEDGNSSSSGWIYHEILGWTHVIRNETESEFNACWMWNEVFGWIWTGDQYFTFFYSNNLTAWCILQTTPDTVLDQNQWSIIAYFPDGEQILGPDDFAKSATLEKLELATSSDEIVEVVQNSSFFSEEEKSQIIFEVLFNGSSSTLDSILGN